MTNVEHNPPDDNQLQIDSSTPGGHLISAPRRGEGQVVSGLAPRPLEFQESSGVNLREYWRVFKKRKWLIGSIIMAFVMIAWLQALMSIPLYTSTIQIQIDRNVSKIVEGGSVTPIDTGDNDFLRTQYELLQSRSIAERVVSMVHLGDDPGFLKPRQFSILAMFRGADKAGPQADKSIGSVDRANAAIGMVLANRMVKPVSGSRLVDISYTDPSPEEARKIAQAFAEAFIASTLDKRFQANSYAKTFLDDQVVQMKLRLEQSEKGLLEFAQKEQIVASTTDKASIAETNLASASAALGNIIAERIKNEQLWKQVQNATAINLPQLLTNNVIDGLRAKRNALVTEFQEKSETFQPNYPSQVQITNKIREVDHQLASEVRTIQSAMKAVYESSLSQEREMSKRIETLRGEALDLQKRSIQYNILKREVDTNRTLYEGLLQRLKEVDIAGGSGVNNVFIIDKAELPEKPSSPVMSRALILGLVLGLAVAFAAAYIFEYLDDCIHSPDEAEKLFGLTTLGVIPKIKPPSTVEAEFADVRSALAEAYRSLCTALQFSTEAGLPKTICVTSCASSEGKSVTSLAIARQFSMMGLNVLLIDGDLRNASLHKKLGVENSVGLSNYLTGSCSPPDAIRRTVHKNLFFMSSGPLPPNAADLLVGSRLLTLLTRGLEVFDLVVIDGPPVLGLADAPLLSAAVNATVFVLAAGQTRIGPVRIALKRLETSRTPIIGAVVTKFDAKTATYGYDYGYGYGYGYGQDVDDEHDNRLEGHSEEDHPQLNTGHGSHSNRAQDADR
ncbi:MAG: polysaccharide biosynthesis tyrosine autokinase [Methylocystis sp.]